MTGRLFGARTRGGNTRITAFLLAAALCTPSVASAALEITLDGGTDEFSGAQNFSGSVDIRFEDSSDAGVMGLTSSQVRLIIDTTGVTSNLTTFKLTGFYFNLSSTAGFSPTAISAVLDTSSPDSASPFTLENSASGGYKADGDGNFSFLLDLPPPGMNTLDANEEVWFILEREGGGPLTAANFNAISVGGPVGKTGFTVAAHIQGIGTDDEGSGWFGDTNGGGGPGVLIPEPSTFALAIGCVAPIAAIGFIRRRRQGKGEMA